MHSSDAWRYAAALALVLATLLVPASGGLAPPPAWLVGSRSSAASVVELRAPAHLIHRTLTPADEQEHFQAHAIRRRSDGDALQSVGLLSGAYDVALHVATPAQLVFVQLDTGSADLWITSSRCSSQQCTADGVLKLEAAASTTFQPIELVQDAPLNLTASSFGDNTTQSSTNSNTTLSKRQSKQQVPFAIYYDDTTAASGVLGSDQVSIAGLDAGRQVFALISQTNVTLGAQGISGVLGLGFARGSTIARSLVRYENEVDGASSLPLLTTLMRRGNVSYPMFGLYLTASGGRATFGAVDPAVLPTEKDRGLVEWHDVVPFPSGDATLPGNATLNTDASALGQYVQWVVRLTAAGIAGESVSITPTYPQVRAALALIDSGSSSILGPAREVEAIMAKITNSRHVGGGRFVVPCDTTERMYFGFGGRNITLLPQDYLIGPDALQPWLCFAWPAVGRPDATGVDWILGTPFLRATYALFSLGIQDREAPKIGLYPLRQPPDATAAEVVFQPQQTQSVRDWISASATTIASILPNSLVSIQTPTTAAYFFANATTTPAVGALPSRAAPTSTFSPLLPTQQAGTANSLPVVASSTPLAPPTNPALPTASSNHAATITPNWPTALLLTTAALLLLA